VNVVRAPWTNASFLLYLGGLTVLISTIELLGVLEADYGQIAVVGWSLLALGLLAALAFLCKATGRDVAAGLFAVSAVGAFAFFLFALLDWFGWLPNLEGGPFEGFHVGPLLAELLVVVAALVALRMFRFPLLVFVAAAVSWFFVTDLLSGGGDWGATVTITFGVVLLLIAIAVDAGPSSAYGLWLHVVAGLTIGGGLLWFWHTSNADWILIAVAGLVYIAVSDRLMRSSWAVLGAWGLLQATSHFVEEWTNVPVSGDFIFFPFLFPFALAGDYEDTKHEWLAPFSFAVLGLVFMAIGLFLAWRRRGLAPPAVA